MSNSTMITQKPFVRLEDRLPTTDLPFDRSRLNHELYANLSEPQYSVKFMGMVRDYMQFLRSSPVDDTTFYSLQEDVECFVKCINSDIAWPLARTVVPEFRDQNIEHEEFQGPMRYVIRAVSWRTKQAATLDQCIPQYEKDLEWRRIRSQLDYLCSVSEGKCGQATATARKSMKDEIDNLSTRITECIERATLHEEDDQEEMESTATDKWKEV